MAEIPESFIEEVLARSDIVDVVGRRVPLKKKGKEYAACCPFHQEKTPSFYVSPDKQFYHCFGCGAHGTAIRFLMDYDRMGFRDAVEQLAQDVGLTLPDSAQIPDQVDQLAPLRQLMQEATDFYRGQLRQHPEAIDYLKQRGLQGQTAARFGLGFAPGGNALLHSDLGKLHPRRLIEAGLAVERDDGDTYDRFRRRIMFPIRDRRGRVIGFGGRIVGPGEPKYLNSPETALFHKGNGVYGLYEARQADARPSRLIIVEGYMDVVMLSQHGINNAVATMGTATTPEQVDLLYRQTPTLVFCFDGDNAGRRAAIKALEVGLTRLSDGRDLRFLFLPEGDDPDSYVRAQPEGQGAQRFHALIEEQALSFDRFLRQHLETLHPGDDPAQRTRRFEAGKALLERMPDGALKRLSLRELGEDLGIWRKRSEWQNRNAGQTSAPPQPPRARPKQRAYDALVLAIVLKHPQLGQPAADTARWFGGAIPEDLRRLAQQPPTASVQQRALAIVDADTRKQAMAMDMAGLENAGTAQQMLVDALQRQKARDELDDRKQQQKRLLQQHKQSQ